MVRLFINFAVDNNFIKNIFESIFLELLIL